MLYFGRNFVVRLERFFGSSVKAFWQPRRHAFGGFVGTYFGDCNHGCGQIVGTRFVPILGTDSVPDFDDFLSRTSAVWVFARTAEIKGFVSIL